MMMCNTGECNMGNINTIGRIQSILLVLKLYAQPLTELVFKLHGFASELNVNENLKDSLQQMITGQLV